MKKKVAVIIGAGPAGLTAAYELVTRTDITPIVLEKTDRIGGIATTINFHGNRIDIGGHRFFSKSDRVMDWWLRLFPLERAAGSVPVALTYHQAFRQINGMSTVADPATTDAVMLLRQRKSRIYFLGKFFDYPVQLSADTLRKLGLMRMMRIGISYLRRALFPIRPEKNLEDFFINRFGKELYQTFFKSYTEKVWGMPCTAIGADWGKQRIKGLSVGSAIKHWVFEKIRPARTIDQKKIETSLIQQFLYPKYGPGQLWEEVARRVTEKGGKILFEQTVDAVHAQNGAVTSVETADTTGNRHAYTGDYFFSTMPVRELVRALGDGVPPAVRAASEGLQYRDFLTVGVLLKKIAVRGAGQLTDNWIYIQEPDVRVGRMQIFNNWSPYMVRDPNTVLIGLEYFCKEGDDLWTMPDDQLCRFAISEVEKIGIIATADVVDSIVVRMPKAYPAYTGTYGQFGTIRFFVDTYANLFLVGRNGMHKYNNQDHSMLTAMLAVEHIMAGDTNKEALWAVNTEEDYHEEK